MERSPQADVEQVEAFDMQAAEERAINEAVDRAKEKPGVLAKIKRFGALAALTTGLMFGERDAAAKGSTEGGDAPNKKAIPVKVMAEKVNLEAVREAWKDAKIEDSSTESARKAWAEVEAEGKKVEPVVRVKTAEAAAAFGGTNINETRTGTPIDVTFKQGAESERKIKESLEDGDTVGYNPNESK